MAWREHTTPAGRRETDQNSRRKTGDRAGLKNSNANSPGYFPRRLAASRAVGQGISAFIGSLEWHWNGHWNRLKVLILLCLYYICSIVPMI